MPATFHFDLVSPEKLAFSGEVDQVDVPGVEGDFGVLAGHAPVVAAIRPGILTVTTGGTHQKIIVLGGLAEVSDKGLTVLADVATSLRGTGSGEVRRHRFPTWKPSSTKRKAPNSTAPSSGSIISRASSTSSTPRRCINLLRSMSPKLSRHPEERALARLEGWQQAPSAVILRGSLKRLAPQDDAVEGVANRAKRCATVR